MTTTAALFFCANYPIEPDAADHVAARALYDDIRPGLEALRGECLPSFDALALGDRIALARGVAVRRRYLEGSLQLALMERVEANAAFFTGTIYGERGISTVQNEAAAARDAGDEKRARFFERVAVAAEAQATAAAGMRKAN
jgi:hypothetical protein